MAGIARHAVAVRSPERRRCHAVSRDHGALDGARAMSTVSYSPDNLYRDAIVVDATAPVAPFTTIQSTFGPDELIQGYAAAGVTFAIFTVVDDRPNSIEQTFRLIAQN